MTNMTNKQSDRQRMWQARWLTSMTNMQVWKWWMGQICEVMSKNCNKQTKTQTGSATLQSVWLDKHTKWRTRKMRVIGKEFDKHANKLPYIRETNQFDKHANELLGIRQIQYYKTLCWILGYAWNADIQASMCGLQVLWSMSLICDGNSVRVMGSISSQAETEKV